MRTCSACGKVRIHALNGLIRGVDEYGATCSSCGFAQWIPKGDLLLEELSQIKRKPHNSTTVESHLVWKSRQHAVSLGCRQDDSKVPKPPIQTQGNVSSLRPPQLPNKTRQVVAKETKKPSRVAIGHSPGAVKGCDGARPSQVEKLLKLNLERVRLLSGNEAPNHVERETLVHKIFKEKLHECLPNYVERPEQIELALHMAQAVKENKILITEAGVGTGKSLAYLAALADAAPSYGPVIISTRTISLQEQLIDKDLPLAKEIGLKLAAMLAKGQTNYLCYARLAEGHFPKGVSRAEVSALQEWADVDVEGTGDRPTAPEVSDETWDAVNVGDCDDKHCYFYGSCGFIRYKKQRKHFRGIIVCNHNLLVNDLLLRTANRNLWPYPGAIIIDEAHGLPDACRDILSREISTKVINDILQKVTGDRRVYQVVEAVVTQGVMKKIDLSIDKIEKLVRASVESGVFDERGRALVPNTDESLSAIKDIHDSLNIIASGLDTAEGMYDLTKKQSRRVQNIIRKINQITDVITALITDPDNHYVAAKLLHEEQKKGAKDDQLREEVPVELTIAPINVGRFLTDSLWNLSLPVLLTSGTMAVKQDFSVIRKSLGLEEDTRAQEYVSPATMAGQDRVATYIPLDLPEPAYKDGDDAFAIEAADRIADLLKITDGRTLILFTSHRRMNLIYKLLSKKDLPWLLLRQGSRKTLNRFRDDEHSVLCATGSFWEGVDVAGEALQMVIMDKLPFPAPGDPLIQARAIRDGDSNHFESIFLPDMLLRLKQGAGRLIRKESDWGILAILDNRIMKRRYGEDALEVLPEGPGYHDFNDLSDWYQVNRITLGRNNQSQVKGA